MLFRMFRSYLECLNIILECLTFNFIAFRYDWRIFKQLCMSYWVTFFWPPSNLTRSQALLLWGHKRPGTRTQDVLGIQLQAPFPKTNNKED